MSEIYWITRLDYIQGALISFAIISSLTACMAVLVWAIEDLDDDKLLICKRFIRTSTAIFATSILGLIFIPSTKDMLLVYAAGGSIEYIKNNDVAKQLPDKCIQAIDALLDEYIEDNKDYE